MSAGAALGSQHFDRQLRRIGIGQDAKLVVILGGLFHFDSAGERSDDRIVDTLGPHLVAHIDDIRKSHRRRDDRMPVPEN